MRCWHVLGSTDSPTAVIPVVDAWTYHRQAVALVTGQPMPEPLSWQGAFYPLTLASLYSIFGVSVMAARVFQAVIGAGSALLTARLGAIAHSRRMGLIAGMIVALYGPLIYFETELLAEGWAVFWLLLFLNLWTARRDEDRLSRGRAVCTGLALAAATLARPPLLPALALAVALGIPWGSPTQRWGAIWNTGRLLAGFMALMLAVAVVHHREAGTFTPLPGSGGMNLYLGNNPEWTRTVMARPGREWQHLLLLPVRDGAQSATARAAWYRRAAWRDIRTRPAAFAHRTTAKLWRFVSSRELPRNTDVYTQRLWSSPLRLLVWRIGAWGFPFGLLAPLAITGIVIDRHRLPRAWLAVLATYAVTISVFFVTARYRIIAIPLLALAAAGGTLRLAALLHNRSRRAGAWAILGVLVLAAVTALPTHFPEEREPPFFEAELYRLVGNHWLDLDRPGEAEPWLERAAGHDPGDADIRNDYAAALLGVGRVDEALKQAEAALQLAPDDPVYRANVNAIRGLRQRQRLPHP